MKKCLGFILGGVSLWANLALSSVCYAYNKFEILPDLPESLSSQASASTISTNTDVTNILGSQSVGHEPTFWSVLFTLIFVILLIYLVAILSAKLNKAGFKTLKQQGDFCKNHAVVVSTTQLGNSKTLHVIELDGKRMLIGASNSTIQLIKDLGNVEDYDCNEFSHIEIPNIKIPKIEIPKIEIPTIGFSKFVTKMYKNANETGPDDNNRESEMYQEEQDEVVSEEPETSNEILNSLFPEQNTTEQSFTETDKNNHSVDPDEFALYKKYI